MIPPRRPNRLIVAIPDSVTVDTPHQREKTAKIGLVARAAAVFRASEILLYRENMDRDSKDSRLVSTLLDYVATPQYLRKPLFPLDKNLMFAGILPPLRTPNHPLERSSKNISDGEIRDGYVLRSNSEFSLVEIGLDRMAKLDERVPVKTRVTVTLRRRGDELRATRVSRGDIHVYWAFQTRTSRMLLGATLEREQADLAIGTSRLGKPIEPSLESIRQRWNTARKIVLAFGPTTRGILELLRAEGKNPGDVFDFLVNTIPNQGTETVRTEEALVATLAILNLL